MKFKFNGIALIFLLLIGGVAYSQSNTDIDVKYRLKPDRSVAKENINFYFDVKQGKLTITDNDFNSQKEYLIKLHETSYDNAGLFNIGFITDVVKHTLEKRPESEIGAFSIIYDEKNGNLVGVKKMERVY